MTYPKMILFDYGNTLLYEPGFDTLRGEMAVRLIQLEILKSHKSDKYIVDEKKDYGRINEKAKFS